ncbi:hypothetical protein KAH94_05525, partial [bacterium]|nr:hypothetical protein [bacterium]
MGKTVKLTTETFIAKAIAKHGNDKFGYDQVYYINSKTKVSILCKNCEKHFMQAPSKHLSGQGCPKASCGGQGKYIQDEFVEAAIKKHGSKYLYDRVVYKTGKGKVEIFCKQCDKYFWQVAGKHLRNGCLKCSERENGLKKRRIAASKFVKRAIAKHGSRYRYDKSVYDAAKSKIEIFCTECGKYFWQEAHSHLNGSGCPCNKGEIWTDELFIKKATSAHGDKYSYENSEIVNSSEKIDIFCKNCGNNFSQSPSKHAAGHGCPKSSCGGHQKLTHGEFVKKGREKFGDKYEYNDQYINSQTKIKIRCTTCWNTNHISPNSHLTTSGGGCSFCNGGLQSNTEDFIKKAKKSHAHRHYSYEKFIYVNAKTKGLIFCNVHNEYFAAAPYNHLSIKNKNGTGCGCPKCGREIVNEASRKPFDVFLSQAIEIHGSIYEYDKDSYNGVKHKMNIYCQEHGLFKQDPDCHINGKQGCPACKSSRGEKSARYSLER